MKLQHALILLGITALIVASFYSQRITAKIKKA